MSSDKKSFLMYADQNEIFSLLPDELAGKLIKHIFKYVNDENPTSDDLMLNLAFTPIKLALNRNSNKWDESKKNKAHGANLTNLKRWHKDIYKEFEEGKISLEEAINIMQDRLSSLSDKSDNKESLSDNERQDLSLSDFSESLPVAQVAVSVSVSDSVSVNDINNNSIAKTEKVFADDRFSEFWDLYGKKNDRKKCESKWLKLSKKSIDKIFEVLPNYIKATPDINFRKKPLHWLDGECWNDEINNYQKSRELSIPDPSKRKEF